MKKFDKVLKPFAGDFYTITEQDGEKFIHIDGYTYKSDSEEFVSEDNPNGIYWAHLQVCWFVYSLKEFIAKFKEKGAEFVEDNYCNLNQYQSDNTAEQMTNAINHYFDGKPADAYLGFGEITESTPCGNYVCLTY